MPNYLAIQCLFGGEGGGNQNQPLRVCLGKGTFYLHHVTSWFQFSFKGWNDSFHSKGSYSSLALGILMLSAAI